MVLLALLLMISNDARRPDRERAEPDLALRGRASVNVPISKPLRDRPAALRDGRRVHLLLVGDRRRGPASRTPRTGACCSRRRRSSAARSRRSDGELIAESIPVGSTEGQKFYERRYPLGDLFGHPVGYYFLDRGRIGRRAPGGRGARGPQGRVRHPPRGARGPGPGGRRHHGRRSTRTAQRVAYESLAGRNGAVVAIEPSTGASGSPASNPPFDPNEIQDSQTFKALNTNPETPLVNRATQSGYQPGSTMKVVTATAALDSGEFTPDTVLNGDTGVEISGVPLENSGEQDFGDIDMTTALTNSVNTYWAQVGEQLGNDMMFEYMDRFGFNETPPVEYPSQQLVRERDPPGRQAARARRLDRHGPGRDRPGAPARHADPDGARRRDRRQRR